MSLEHLLQIASELPPGALAEVVDFATWLRDRQGVEADETAATLDDVCNDPARLARWREAIQVAMVDSDRGAGIPADEVFAELRKRSERLQAKE